MTFYFANVITYTISHIDKDIVILYAVIRVYTYTLVFVICIHVFFIIIIINQRVDKDFFVRGFLFMKIGKQIFVL